MPAIVRAAVQADFDALGETAFRERLARVDPAAEQRIARADRQRLTRALEVFEAGGRPLSAWQGTTRPALATDAWRGVVLTLPRPELYARVDARLATMIAAGALAEVEALMARRLDPALPAMKALGVASLAAHLAGRLTAEAALAEARGQTRRYAKRQLTWFDRQTADWPRLPPTADVEALSKILRRSPS